MWHIYACKNITQPQKWNNAISSNMDGPGGVSSWVSHTRGVNYLMWYVSGWIKKNYKIDLKLNKKTEKKFMVTKGERGVGGGSG